MLEKILSLTLKQKIGQLFFIGISGTELNKDISELLNEISPGGICFFARNVKTTEQVTKLLDDIRQILPVEPVLSIDQEGGVVDRLRRILTPMPSANSINSLEQVKTLAETTAEILLNLGFNMNFAPVVDILDADRKTFLNGLYSRAFGENKDDVVRFAGEYLKVLQSSGCLGCVKHFPGLGASEVDSHEELPVVNLSREQLFEKDLFPYLELFKTGEVHAVMTAHASFPKFDLQETDSNGKLLPSSLSGNIVTKLLREELSYEGLTISDDLEMGAILKNYGIGEACKMAINAGQDMLAICANPESIRNGFQAILEAVKTGEISESRINQSLTRIAHLKTLIKSPSPFDAARLSHLSDKIAVLNEQLQYNYGG